MTNTHTHLGTQIEKCLLYSTRSVQLSQASPFLYNSKATQPPIFLTDAKFLMLEGCLKAPDNPHKVVSLQNSFCCSLDHPLDDPVSSSGWKTKSNRKPSPIYHTLFLIMHISLYSPNASLTHPQPSFNLGLSMTFEESWIQNWSLLICGKLPRRWRWIETFSKATEKVKQLRSVMAF